MAKPEVNWRAWICEFLGTLMLCLAVNTYTWASAGGNHLGVVFGIALMLMLQIYCFGSVSGGHFNPAVTFCLALSGKMGNWLDYIMYPLMQFLGGVSGCFLGLVLATEKLGDSNVYPTTKFEWYDVVCVEVIYTFMLASVVCNVACTKVTEGNQFFALAIGFVVLAGGSWAGGVGAGCFNPAVAVGKDIASLLYSDSSRSSYDGFKLCSLYYTAAELVGAGIASLAFRVVRPEEFGNNVANGLASRLVAEFIGTFLLTYTVYGVVFFGVAGGAIAVAAALLCNVYAWGTCSGGHLNPAVTVAVAVSGRGLIKLRDVFLYILVQIVAGFLAVLAAGALLSSALDRSVAVDAKQQGLAYVIAYDILLTFLLGFVVLSAATTTNAYKDMFGFIIGFVIIAAGFTGGKAGVGLNPAVMLALDWGHAIFRNDAELKYSGWGFLYLGLELAGGALAGGVFRAVRPEQYKKDDEEGEEAADEETGDEEAAAAA